MKDKYLEIFGRYIFLILIALPNLYLFYWIFTPLTVYSFYLLANLIYSQNSLIISSIQIIPACVAGSAYYFLLVLNLALPSVKLQKRVQMIFFAWSIFFLVNLARILLLPFLAFSSPELFFALHKFFWYFVSTIFIVLIWFLEVRIFKIKQIPFYSDFKFLYSKSLFKK